MSELNQRLADELSVRPRQVAAAITLLDDGATVPFIARYRKEATDGLDDTQLRQLEQRLGYLRELEERRCHIIETIRDLDKLTPALAQQLAAAETKTRLEDLFLPYKSKRRTKAQAAVEAGLTGLAERLLGEPHQSPVRLARDYLAPDHQIHSTEDALDGAQAILVERFAEDAELVAKLRRQLWDHATLEARQSRSKKAADAPQLQAKFKDYIGHTEALRQLPPHRILALLRGKSEGVLSLAINPDPRGQGNYCEVLIARRFNIRHQGRAADDWLQAVVSTAWKSKIAGAMETDILGRLRDKAHDNASEVFAANLKDLLMAAPGGPRTTLGLDPGIRTGVKVAVVDGTGKLLATDTIYPHAPRHQWDQSLASLARLIKRHTVELVSIGNGTGSRETDKLVAELQRQCPGLTKVMVNEAGASVYSASAAAAAEFPDLDVTLRGAVSIARRLQDPLAELVKIDAKAIGVGQYQHDLHQGKLAEGLDRVVEDCVNAVGVDLNMASVPLLARISGLNATLATNIVAYRDQHGRFQQRRELLKVSRLGPKAFEQAAGFLRINGGSNPLDASAVHPEAYPVVKRLLQQQGRPLDQVIGNTALLGQCDANALVDDRFGLPTVRDILSELEKPGRDPRPEFITAQFREGVESFKDLQPGMQLEGVITNVTNFGAFVDIGVHQDGLVHISALADRFVEDPRSIVKAGQIVKVTVVEVDQQRKRIALSMRSGAAEPQARRQEQPREKPRNRGRQQPSGRRGQTEAGSTGNSALANAFANAKSRK